MVTKVIEVIRNKYKLPDRAKLYLEHNLKFGARNIFVFYQANINNEEIYPVATLLFLLNDAKEILDKTKGKLYLFYHASNVIAEVYENDFYSSKKGKLIYLKQLNNIKKLSKATLDLDLELISIQEYVKSTNEVSQIYDVLKEKYPFNENIVTWLYHLSKPAVGKILRDVFGSVRAKSLMNHLFIKEDEKYQSSLDLVNSEYKKITSNPRFEEYLAYELLVSIGAPYTHDALFRPNPGANKAMQEWAQSISSEPQINNIFKKNRYYVPVLGIKGLELPFSFVHPSKSENGVNLTINRTNDIKRLEDIIDTNGVFKQKYISLFDKRFPKWKEIVEKIIEFNRTYEVQLSKSPNAEIAALKIVLVKQDTKDLPDNVRELIAERIEARRKRDWNFADKIREKLVNLGYYPEDEIISAL